MAKDETRETLLQTLTSDKLGEVPAHRDEREAEPREPVEPSRDIERGKRPEEVVTEPERRPAPTKGKEPEKPAAPKLWKIRVDDGSGEPVIRELTAEQMAAEGLLDRIITTSNQFPAVQKKYQDLLERNAGKEPEKPVSAPAKAPPPTPVQIRNAYASMLRETVDGGYIEPDFAEAYPDVAHNLMYWRDIIEDVNEKMGQLITWVNSEVQLRNAVQVQRRLDSAVEVIAGKGDGDKGDPLFKDLRKPDVRKAFTEWLRTEVDPKVASLTSENMERFWFAYNAREILDFTKEAAQKAAEPPSRRRAASDGSSSRPGAPEPPREKTLLDRMSDLRLNPEG